MPIDYLRFNSLAARILRTTSATKNNAEHRLINTTVNSLPFIFAIQVLLFLVILQSLSDVLTTTPGSMDLCLLSLILSNSLAHPIRYYEELELVSLHQ